MHKSPNRSKRCSATVATIATVFIYHDDVAAVAFVDSDPENRKKHSLFGHTGRFWYYSSRNLTSVIVRVFLLVMVSPPSAELLSQ